MCEWYSSSCSCLFTVVGNDFVLLGTGLCVWASVHHASLSLCWNCPGSFHLLLHPCLCHHSMLLSPCFLQRPICVPFSGLFLPQLSLRPEHSHSFMFKPVCSKRARKLYCFAFYFRRPCESRLDYLGRLLLIGGTSFNLLVNKHLTLIVVYYDFYTFLGCYFWAMSQLLYYITYSLKLKGSHLLIQLPSPFILIFLPPLNGSSLHMSSVSHPLFLKDYALPVTFSPTSSRKLFS